MGCVHDEVSGSSSGKEEHAASTITHETIHRHPHEGSALKFGPKIVDVGSEICDGQGGTFSHRFTRRSASQHIFAPSATEVDTADRPKMTKNLNENAQNRP